jgi:hypothetical protein
MIGKKAKEGRNENVKEGPFTQADVRECSTELNSEPSGK